MATSSRQGRKAFESNEGMLGDENPGEEGQAQRKRESERW